MKEKEIFDGILHTEKICTLATASKDGKPEAATILFAADKQDNIFFETSIRYRKYKNLMTNPRASIVITQYLYTVQMDGKTEQINSKIAKQHLIKKYGEKKFYDHSDIRFFKFTPAWICLTEARWPLKQIIIKS